MDPTVFFVFALNIIHSLDKFFFLLLGVFLLLFKYET